MSKRVPYISGHELSDCGAACLAMVLAYHGRQVPVAEVREATGTSRDGVTARGIVDAARSYHLNARGVRLDVDDIHRLPSGSILHWGGSHFVVLGSHLRGGGIEVLDPAVGPSRVDKARLSKLFTGIGIVLEPGAGFEQGGQRRSSVTVLLRRLVANDAGALRRTIAASVVLRVLAVTVPVLTGVLVDRIVPGHDRRLLAVVAAAVVVVGLQLLALSIIRAQLLLRLRTSLDMRMTVDFVTHLLGLPFDFFLRRSGGDLIARVRSNAIVRDMLTAAAVSALIDGTLALLYLVLLLVASPVLGTLTLFAALLQTLVLVVSHRRNRYLMSEQLQAEARSQAYLLQLLRGVETVKAIGAEPQVVEHFANRYADELNVSYRRARLVGFVEALIATVRLVAPMSILLIGALQVLDGRLSIGAMLGLAALAAGFLDPVASLVSTLVRLQPISSYMERIQDVLEAEGEGGGSRRPAPRLEGHLATQSVVFRYNPSQPPVISNVSIDVPPGSTLAVVGRSGSGKSTLGRLLVGLYEPENGVVLHDGLDLTTLTPRSVRLQFGVVTQDPYLFGLSVRDNITLRSPAMPFDEVVEAARIACIHDDIIAMPLGYDTVLTDAGASLSGGQRQRVAIARAVVERPQVVLLDEATSALDALTEAEVYENLSRLDTTIIVIAHRLSTIASADKIVVLEAGSLVEAGSHAELLAADGHYAALVRAQTAYGPDHGAP